MTRTGWVHLRQRQLYSIQRPSVPLPVCWQRMNANAELQKQIVNYAKTRAVYVEYRKAGYSKKFRTAHEAEILLHQAAKNRFDELGIKKLPLCQISPGGIHRSSGTKTESLFCL